METQLVPTNGNTSLSVPADYIPVAGYEGLGADDFSLPTFKLVQGQSKFDGAIEHLGWYYNTATGEFVKEANALIIGISKSRIMFVKPFDPKADPLCRSDDSHTPRAEFVGQKINGDFIPAKCELCPFSKFGDDGSAPPCALSENWAAILDTLEPVVLRFKGTNSKTSAMLKSVMRANRFKKRPTYVRLGSLFEKTDKGQYYVSTITPIKENPPTDLLEIARELAGVNLASYAAEAGEEHGNGHAVEESNERPF